ncbi:hypothetical protein ACWEP8_36135 [Streptomyces hydrogenans]
MDPTQLSPLATGTATVLGAILGSITTLVTTRKTRREGQRNLHANEQLEVLNGFWVEAVKLRGWGAPGSEYNSRRVLLAPRWEKARALVPASFNEPAERLVEMSKEANALGLARSEHDDVLDVLRANATREARTLEEDPEFHRLCPDNGLENAQELFSAYKAYLDGQTSEDDARRAFAHYEPESWPSESLEHYFAPKRNPLYVRQRQAVLARELSTALDTFEKALNDWVNRS